MSSRNNNHFTDDSKGHEHIAFWRCSEYRWNGLFGVGYFLLAFSVPVLYMIFGDIEMGKEEPDEEGFLLGEMMVFIMWWTILAIFSIYREKIRDLKYELLKMKAISYKLTRKEIEDASKKNLLDGLRYFLENIQEKHDNTTMSKEINYNIKAINFLLAAHCSASDFEKLYKHFCDYTKDNIWS